MSRERAILLVARRPAPSRTTSRPRKDHPDVDLISDVLPFGRLWYGEPNAISNAIGYAKFRSRSHDAMIRVYAPEGSRTVGVWEAGIALGKRICFALSGGNRFVRPLLTASSVIAVMPACMLTVPNPGSRSEWPAHCDRGIHYVWPCKFGVELLLVVVSTIAAHIPRKQNEAAKQHH
jgi:hypothetical protein